MIARNLAMLQYILQKCKDLIILYLKNFLYICNVKFYDYAKVKYYYIFSYTYSVF
jgi:hypothetical protein